MADLKVTLQFNDENATSFTYDKLNGLKSLSFLNESKTNDEDIDYSVKSNTGSFSAIDIVKSTGYINEFFNTFEMKTIEEDVSSSANFRGMCYNEEDDMFYIANFGYGYAYSPIYKTNDFKTFLVQELPSHPEMNIDGIIKFQGHIVCTGWIYNNGYYSLGYVTYNGSTLNYYIVGETTQSAVTSQLVTRCLKIENGKLFISMGDYNYEMVNFYIDSLGGEIHKITIPFSYTPTYKFFLDVLYSDNKYIFLSNYGVFETVDFSSYTSLYSSIAGVYIYRGSLIHHNGFYYFTDWEKGIYKTVDFESFEFVKMPTNGGIINISKLDNLFLLITNNNEVYYSSDLKSATKSNIRIYSTFVSFATSPKYVAISTSASGGFYDSYITYSQEKKTELFLYDSLYNYLRTKPKYDKIYIGINLDGKPLGSFINSGKIEYDNNTRELNLNFQNNIVLLQNKKYKMQIDKYKIGSTTLLDILNQLITLASGLIGQEFEIDSATQTYLGSVNVQYPYLEEASVWEQLNKVCVAGQLSIYPSGIKIKVERWV